MRRLLFWDITQLKLSRNVCNHLPNCKEQNPRKVNTSTTQPLRPEIFFNFNVQAWNTNLSREYVLKQRPMNKTQDPRKVNTSTTQPPRPEIFFNYNVQAWKTNLPREYVLKQRPMKRAQLNGGWCQRASCTIPFISLRQSYSRAVLCALSHFCTERCNARFELLVTSSWRCVPRPYQIVAYFRPRRSSWHTYYMCSCKLIHPSNENVITSRANSASSCRGIHFVLLSAACVSIFDTGNVRSVYSPLSLLRYLRLAQRYIWR
jgi:hypothetical protein